MSSTSLEERSATAPETGPRGFRWWLRVIEVRLRFVAVVLVALVVVTQWGHLRNAWDRLGSAAGGAAATAVSADTEFVCPMDPGVLSAWPAVCPICNMDLVRRHKHDAQILPEGVVARMQFSPYRIQLAGIRTTEVVTRPLNHELRLAGKLKPPQEGSDETSQGLWFDAALSPADVSLLADPRDATVRIPDGAESTSASARLVEDNPPRVRITLATPSPEFAPGRSVDAVIHVPVSEGTDGEPLVVPEPAVVDHGDRRIVFVESMPGQFDAVPVKLGRRVGDVYPVLDGLEPGQRVASAGAFLIDAETRLNPSLAVAYFGAGGNASASRAPQVRVASSPTEAPKLSAEDLEQVRRQKTCPVTDLPLDSMGGPIPVTVDGRKIFLCCAGCEDAIKSDPAKYLAKLPADD